MRLLIDHGTYAYSNLGDLAMLEGALSRLLNRFPNADISVIDTGFIDFTGNFGNLNKVSLQTDYKFVTDDPNFILRKIPFGGRRVPGLNARIKLPILGALLPPKSMLLANRKTPLRRMKLTEFCEPFDALHICGGGFLTDTFRSLLLSKCSLILTFIAQGKPVVLTGQQLGPFTNPFHEKTLYRTLRHAAFVGVRESTDSFAICQKAGLETEHFEIMGDDSFGCPASEDLLVSALLDQYGLEPCKFIAFNFRTGFYVKETAKYLQQVAELMLGLANQLQLPILVVPIYIGSDPNNDIEYGKKLAELTQDADILVLDDKNLTPALVKGVMGQAFGAIGVSYHFCTFALGQGVPAICIYDGDYYSQKARGLCGFWKDNRLALSLQNMDPESAVTHTVQVFEDEILREHLKQRAEHAVKEWQRIFDQAVQSAFGKF